MSISLTNSVFCLKQMNFDFVFRAVSSVWGTMSNFNFKSYKSYLINDSVLNSKNRRIKPWQVENFFKIIDEDENLARFLWYDKCCRIADNYLIAMVFVYFIRADFEVEEYTLPNFIAALHLALDMEEEDDNLHNYLQSWMNVNNKTFDILEERYKIFQRTGFRGSVTRTCCETVMQKIKPDHHVWKRRRHINHSGAVNVYSRKRIMCPMCI